MEIDTRKSNGITVLGLSGRVRSSEVAVLMARLARIKEEAEAGGGAPPRVVLDLGGLDNLPTAVVGALIEAIRSVESVGGRFALASPDEAVRVALDRLGVAQLVTTYASTDEAVRALGADAPEVEESGPAS